MVEYPWALAQDAMVLYVNKRLIFLVVNVDHQTTKLIILPNCLTVVYPCPMFTANLQLCQHSTNNLCIISGVLLN